MKIKNTLTRVTSIIDNIEFDGINWMDYPDFSDAYVVSADKNGVPMTCEEIDNLDPDFLYEKLMEKIT